MIPEVPASIFFSERKPAAVEETSECSSHHTCSQSLYPAKAEVRELD